MADSVRTADSSAAGAISDGGTFAFWSGIASIVGLILTVVGLGFTIWSLRKAVEAQKGAEQAREDAEALRNQYARKQRLPQFRDQLDDLATQLDTVLNDFSEMQVEAQETTTQITRTIQSLTVHLHDDQLSVVTDLAGQIQRHSGRASLQNGQQVKSCTREVVLYLTHIIDDERAKSL
jgi:septal ring factor EnvC (AmiA/AmiB activator)